MRTCLEINKGVMLVLSFVNKLCFSIFRYFCKKLVLRVLFDKTRNSRNTSIKVIYWSKWIFRHSGIEKAQNSKWWKDDELDIGSKCSSPWFQRCERHSNPSPDEEDRVSQSWVDFWWRGMINEGTILTFSSGRNLANSSQILNKIVASLKGLLRSKTRFSKTRGLFFFIKKNIKKRVAGHQPYHPTNKQQYQRRGRPRPPTTEISI